MRFHLLHRPRSPSLVLALAAATLLAGCAAPAAQDPPAASPTPAASPSPPAQPPRADLVHMVQEGDRNVFDPETFTIAAGKTVTWDIVGEGHHTVDFLQPIDAAGTTPKSGDVGPGQTFEVRFDEPGSYRYYCKYHSNKQTGMIGTIVVQ